VINFEVPSDDVLAEKVFIEAKSTESELLGNSTKLRNRLLQGLCEYYGVSGSDIETKAGSLVKYGYMNFSIGESSLDIICYGALDSKEDHLKEAMVELLALHINVNVLQDKII